MKSVSNLFSILDSELPDRWIWCSIYIMFGDSQSQEFTEYRLSSDDEEKNINTPNGVREQMYTFRDEIAVDLSQQPTHIQLTIESDGKFDTVVGYGAPNWDIMPSPWPDDITAENYTYTKAWPDGLPEKIRKRLKDPRSLIGYD